MKPPNEWAEADIHTLIGQQESARLEFKSGRLFDSRENALETLSKEVSAFANSEGGVLILGIREERTGTTRVAASVDGVDGSTVSREWLQQVVEANVSPYLPGIHYRYVPLSGDLSGRVCIIITVPQGTTAYQAKDCRYYGRSDFQVRALPDHEIRLRMQRSRLARATVDIFDWSGTGDPDWGVEVDPALPATEVEDLMPLIVGSEILGQAPILGRFRLGIRNTGEVTLKDFLVEYEFDLREDITLGRGTDKLSGFGLDEGWKYRFASDGHIRVYPGDRVRFPDEVWSVAADDKQAFDPESATLKWTVFLDNAPSVSGTVDLGQHFAFNRSPQEPY